MNRLLRLLFILGVAWPVTLVWLGLNVRHRRRLPLRGPAIVVANHNSHLDILVLYTLFPVSRVLRVRPAAAADYFLTGNRLLAWFSTRLVGIIPVPRGAASRQFDPLAGCHEALRRGDILIIFPEGTRGEPEQLSAIKSGVWHLGREHPGVPIIPVYMHGLGRSMARGQWIPVPFFVDVFVDTPFPWQENRTTFKTDLQARFATLQSQATRHSFEAHKP
ncbi:glycerol acyltransferase [Opitutaceae bacterium TAV5]|nr:glycerol acyltransferase [Opitutaceae bacterium TAV5]